MSLNTPFNDWTLSTPVPLRTYHNLSSSTGSILRLSSSSNIANTTNTKRVRIVSPIKWHSKSKWNSDRKRMFINTTISYCDIKHILRSLGCDPRGGYKECVDRLLQSDWTPDPQLIRFNDRLRAKPIQKPSEKVVNLHCGDIHYLSNFTMKELKKWLEYNNIQQPVRQNKTEYIKLINKIYKVRSPSPDSIRVNTQYHRRNYSNKKKTESKTPRIRKKINFVDDMKGSEMNQEMNDEIYTYNPMELCFDDLEDSENDNDDIMDHENATNGVTKMTAFCL